MIFLFHFRYVTKLLQLKNIMKRVVFQVRFSLYDKCYVGLCKFQNLEKFCIYIILGHSWLIIKTLCKIVGNDL